MLVHLKMHVGLNSSLFIKYVLVSFENLADSTTAAVLEEEVPESIEREADEEAEGSAKVGDQRDK